MRAWAIWSVKSGSVGNRIFYAWMWWFLASSQGRSSVPSSALLRVGKSRKHSVNTEVIVDSSISRSWTPHAIFLSDRNDPLWECWYNLSNLTNQRVYQELVYRNGSFKKMITGSAARALPSFLPFYFGVRTFSIRRTRQSRSLEQATT